MRMRTSGGREVRLERSERTLRQQRPAGRATKWRVILYHRPNSKSLLNEQAFLHLQLMRMRTSGGREVRLERSERTLRQQRPAGRATKWRVILYHRPNSKSLLSEQAFLHLKPMRMRTSGGWEVRLDVGLIRRASVASGNGTALIVGCGATALFDLHTTHFPAKFAPHISLSINGFVTETIVFFLYLLKSFFALLMADPGIFRCAF